ncbi:MAG: aspartate/glutamate racemase family protein [Chloroflexi bacterium]|nr:aspartate/glutamate racemase family protein [Chloroflexota bacterium]
MRIKVINGNTFVPMTENIGEVARSVAAIGTEVVHATPKAGPISIESFYDEYLAIPSILESIIEDEANFDAFVIACWGDPGIEAAREITRKPVVGIAEASMYVANMLGAKFGVVTVLDRAHNLIEHTVNKVGLMPRCASIQCTSLSVIETEELRDHACLVLEGAGRKAIAEGAEVLALGCAGMSGLDIMLEQRLGVPVVDSVAAAIKMAEALVALGKTTSKVKTYARPEPKEIRGYPAHMQSSTFPE